jgi:transmembrane sensor
MKQMNKNRTSEQSDREWELLASGLSGENGAEGKGTSFYDSDSTAELWKSMDKIREEGMENINTDRAWTMLHNRIIENNLLPEEKPGRRSIIRRLPILVRIAAMVVIVAGLGWGTSAILRNTGAEMMLASTSGIEKNLTVDLPDGSRVILNHDTELSYPAEFEKGNRNVSLTGEAFFDIKSNPSSPFIIDAGKATIRVLGTSFNVNTSNRNDEVEVYVKSGKVLFTAINGSENIQLEEGFMGIATEKSAEKRVNENPNYLAWNSGTLVYEGTRLETVFNDLYSVYGVKISVTDQTIMDNTITTVFQNLTEEELIRIISSTFGLSWSKEGRVYVLSR